VLANEGSILNFFRKHHPSETGPYGVVPEVMDTYVRSCGEYEYYNSREENKYNYCYLIHILKFQLAIA